LDPCLSEEVGYGISIIPNLIEKYSNFYGPFAIFIAQFAMWIDLDGRDS